MAYDLIILDPPSFTKTKGGLRDALRGYRELHVRAFKLLSHGGLLASFGKTGEPGWSFIWFITLLSVTSAIGTGTVLTYLNTRLLEFFEKNL